MIRPKNETEDLLLSITKKCEMLNNQTHRKAEGTLELKLIKPRETFHFIPPISLEGSWMIGLTSFELYNPILLITEHNNKFELYTHDSGDEFSFVGFEDKIAKVLALSHISSEDLQHGRLGVQINKTYRKLSIEKSQTDG